MNRSRNNLFKVNFRKEFKKSNNPYRYVVEILRRVDLKQVHRRNHYCEDRIHEKWQWGSQEEDPCCHFMKRNPYTIVTVRWAKMEAVNPIDPTVVTDKFEVYSPDTVIIGLFAMKEHNDMEFLSDEIIQSNIYRMLLEAKRVIFNHKIDLWFKLNPIGKVAVLWNGISRLTSRFTAGKIPASNLGPSQEDSKEEEAAKNDVWNGRFEHPGNQTATALIGVNAFNI